MKTKNGFVLRTLGKEHILMPEGLEVADTTCMISLNETAAFLWKAIEGKDFDSDTLVSLIVDEYEVTPEVAKNDVDALLQTWEKAGIIQY